MSFEECFGVNPTEAFDKLMDEQWEETRMGFHDIQIRTMRAEPKVKRPLDELCRQAKQHFLVVLASEKKVGLAQIHVLDDETILPL